MEEAPIRPRQEAGPPASVIQHKGPQVGYKGLLGMDELPEGSGFRVDAKREVIT
jgi:hypothetical protein